MGQERKRADLVPAAVTGLHESTPEIEMDNLLVGKTGDYRK